jgi:integrase
MGNQKVTLMRYCKVDEGEHSVWKRYPVAVGKNGKLRPDYVVIKAQQVHAPTGHYELRFYEGSKLRYENVGNNVQTALTKKQTKERTLTAKTAADVAGIKIIEQEGRKNIRKESNRYIKELEGEQKIEASNQARYTLDEFIPNTKKTFLDELTKEDFTNFYKALRKRGLSDRTVANRHQRLSSFLRNAKVNMDIEMPDKPTYTKTLPTIYEPQEVGALLNAADDYMRLVIELGLKCGLRELEIVYLEWSDIQGKTVKIQEKPKWGFKVKDAEERAIPIPDDLLTHLGAWKETHGKDKLILGTKSSRPNMHLLRQLKRLVNRAGLNCKACDGCTSEVKECENWTLHKLRRTYATTLLRNGRDIRTVMQFCGWSDMQTAMNYLRPADAEEVQQAISSIQFSQFPE